MGEGNEMAKNSQSKLHLRVHWLAGVGKKFVQIDFRKNTPTVVSVMQMCIDNVGRWYGEMVNTRGYD